MRKLMLVGPATVARRLIELEELSLPVSELTDDIRAEPRLYYPEYRWCCRGLGTVPIPEEWWVDLCVDLTPRGRG